jgi:hypothetical protein
MKVAIYARYSSDNQRDASIADQLRICREYAARQGWTVAREFTDHAVSGATLLRAGFQSLMRLEELVDAHDEFIKSSFAQTVKRSVCRVVEFATGSIEGYATGNPLMGLAAGGAMKLVGARLPMISAEPGDSLAQPGAALHKAISVMFHDV